MYVKVTIPQSRRYRLLFLHRMALIQIVIYSASAFPECFAFSGDRYSLSCCTTCFWSSMCLIYGTVLNLTYLLTPWCRVLLEKLTGLQLVKKFPAFHGIRRFITPLTSIRHLSVSWASPIQSIYPHPTSWRSSLISTHLRLGLPSGLLPSGFPTKTLYTPSPHSYAPHAQPISFFSILSPAQYWVRSTSHLTTEHSIFGRTVALGLTQPLTEMSTRNISWEVNAAGAWGWQPYHLHVPIVLKSWSLSLLEPLGPVEACNGIALPLHQHRMILAIRF